MSEILGSAGQTSDIHYLFKIINLAPATKQNVQAVQARAFALQSFAHVALISKQSSQRAVE